MVKQICTTKRVNFLFFSILTVMSNKCFFVFLNGNIHTRHTTFACKFFVSSYSPKKDSLYDLFNLIFYI
jgi:hypothetical protein